MASETAADGADGDGAVAGSERSASPSGEELDREAAAREILILDAAQLRRVVVSGG